MWKMIWNRFMNLFKSKALSALDAAENPVEMYELAVRESDLSIQNMTKAIATALADQKVRERELQHSKLESEAWHQKAKIALGLGHEELARTALEHKNISLKKSEEYHALNEMLRKKIEDQKKQLQRFKLKHEELKAKKSIYAAKYETAKAQKKMIESMEGLNQSGLGDVGRLEEKINRLEAESEALVELSDGQNEIKIQLEDAERSYRVEEDIQKLKEQMALEIKNDSKTEIKLPIENVVPEKKQDGNKDKLLDQFYSVKKNINPPNGKDMIDKFFDNK
jgi:phage shock protein A